jgi:hypothetical protein
MRELAAQLQTVGKAAGMTNRDTLTGELRESRERSYSLSPD